jgi:hypothetical protein
MDKQLTRDKRIYWQNQQDASQTTKSHINVYFYIFSFIYLLLFVFKVKCRSTRYFSL